MNQTEKISPSTKYLHLNKVLNAYTFFQLVNVPLEFSLDDLYFCLVLLFSNQASKQPTYLIQYLMCFCFRKYIQKENIADPYVQLFINSNLFIGECLIYSQLSEMYQFLLSYTENKKFPVELTDTMEMEEKIDVLYELVNCLISSSKWIKGDIEKKMRIYRGGKLQEQYFHSSQQKWQLELQEINNLKDLKREQIRNIANSKAEKSKVKSNLQREIADLDEKAENLKALLSMNYNETKIFGLEPMKKVYKDPQQSVWIIRSMPDYVQIESKDENYLLYGNEVHEYLKNTENEAIKQALQVHDFCKEEKVIKLRDWVNFTQYPFDASGLQKYLKMGGKRDLLIYCQCQKDQNKLIMEMILDIEEKASFFFGKYYEKAWDFPQKRQQWRKQQTPENACENIYNFANTMRFQKKCYKYASEDQVPNDFIEKATPFTWFFKFLSQDLNEVDNCPYTYALLFYSRFLERYSNHLKRESVVVVQEEQKQSQRVFRKKMIDDDDDEQWNPSDYYYK